MLALVVMTDALVVMAVLGDAPHGAWTTWSAWGPCGVSCGGGLQLRTRSCSNKIQVPMGMYCEGVFGAQHVKACSTEACPSAGGWSLWSDWSACSTSCGGGVKTRGRKCDTPKPDKNGEYCVGDGVGMKKCNTETCKPAVRAGWSSWQPWYHCTVTCGGGVKVRERKCDNPPPGPNVGDCIGDAQKFGVCNDQACDAPGQWSQWSTYSACSTTCGSGVMIRKRDCNYDPPQRHNSKYCVGDGISMVWCNRERCHPPLRAGWSPWQPWYHCTVSCGGGVKVRERKCDNPPPGPNVADCIGDAQDFSVCNTQECEAPVIPTDGQWSGWADWYTCTVTCGGGLKLRDRKCDKPSPGPKGRNCVGNSQETRECNTQACVVIGYADWSEWSPWSNCTQECGGGLQLRERTCQNTSTTMDCIGVPQEVQECNKQECVVTTAAPKPPICVTGWKSYEGTCYKFVSYEFSRGPVTALFDCINAGGRWAMLAKIKSKAHNDFIVANKPFGKTAIGASNRGPQGTWLWEDSSPVINWNTGIPVTPVLTGERPYKGERTPYRRERTPHKGDGKSPDKADHYHELYNWMVGTDCALIDDKGYWSFLPCTADHGVNGYVCEIMDPWKDPDWHGPIPQ